MNIDFYTTKDPQNYVNKNLTNETIITGCKLLHETSLLTPVVACRFANIADVAKFNYVKIPQFNRYYFITNVTFKSGGICEISLKVDVLMSAKSDILASSQIIERQQHKRNPMLIDPLYPVGCDNSYAYGYCQNKLINTGDSGIWRGGTYILKTVGGV